MLIRMLLASVPGAAAAAFLVLLLAAASTRVVECQAIILPTKMKDAPFRSPSIVSVSPSIGAEVGTLL